MKRVIILVIAMILSFAACAPIEDKTAEKETTIYIIEYDELYVADSDKAEWYDHIVKLISNQEQAYGTPEDGLLGYKAPRPDEPSIAYGYRMGLLDINVDGVPELLLDLGGGSAGNSYYYIYDIISGAKIGALNGGGTDAWCMYYNTESATFVPIGRYSWRIGEYGDIYFTDTVTFSEERGEYIGKGMLSLEYEYEQIIKKDEDGNIVGVEMKIADAYFSVDGSRCSSDDYYLAYRAFWLTHVIIPDTGLKLFAWSDVSDYSDGDEMKAEKMANMLLYGSGQKFLNFKNGEKDLGD